MSREMAPSARPDATGMVGAALTRIRQARAENQSLPVYGELPTDERRSADSLAFARVRQLRSAYDPGSALELPLGFGDYLSILFRLDEQNRLIEELGPVEPLPLRQAWYVACGTALRDALSLKDTAFDRVAHERPYDPRQIVSDLRQALRAQHGVFQAVYYEIAIGGLLRQRADILRAGRSVTHVEGGPGSGITDEALRARIQAVYFTRFDEALLNFSRQLLDVDALLEELLPMAVAPPVELARLQAEYNYPTAADPRWAPAFTL